MTTIFFAQLIGVLLTAAGMVALTATAHIFGTPMSPAERRRASDEWNRRQDTRRLPINLETILSAICLLGGIGILIWSDFELCGFLAYWLPSLPDALRLVLSCR